MLDSIILGLILLVMIRSIVNALFPGALNSAAAAEDGSAAGINSPAADAPSGPSISSAFHSRATATPTRGHLVPPAMPLPLHVCQIKALLRRLLPEDTLVLSILRLPSAGLFPLVREIQSEERKVHQETIIDRGRFPLPGSSVSVWDSGEGSETHPHWFYLVTKGVWGEVDRDVLDQMMLKEEKEQAWQEKWGDAGEIVKEEEERMHTVVELAKAEQVSDSHRKTGSSSEETANNAGPSSAQGSLPHLFADMSSKDDTELSQEADDQPVPITTFTPPTAKTATKSPSSHNHSSSFSTPSASHNEGSTSLYDELAPNPGPTGHSPWKIKQIEIELKSHDQGWSDTPQHRGTYENSYTWFDIGIMRNGTILPGWYTIQRNKHATRTGTTHVIQMDLNLPLWRSLKRGDRVVVMAKARFPGWVNHVQKAEVRITYGF